MYVYVMHICIQQQSYICMYVCVYVRRCSTHVPLRTVPRRASARWGVPRGAVAPGRACAHTWSGYSSEHALTIYHTLQVYTYKHKYRQMKTENHKQCYKHTEHYACTYINTCFIKLLLILHMYMRTYKRTYILRIHVCMYVGTMYIRTNSLQLMTKEKYTLYIRFCVLYLRHTYVCKYTRIYTV